MVNLMENLAQKHNSPTDAYCAPASYQISQTYQIKNYPTSRKSMIFKRKITCGMEISIFSAVTMMGISSKELLLGGAQ